MSNIQPSVYTDFSGLADLRLQASKNPGEATSEVAKEFEAIFVQMMLKSMREASPEGGLFDSDQMEAYQGMFDKQLSINIASGSGIGLAEVIERQLGGVSKSDTDMGDHMHTFQKAVVQQNTAIVSAPKNGDQ